MSVNKVMSFVKKPVKRVEELLLTSFSSDIEVVNKLVSQTISAGGKRIRPVFHILVAGMCGYQGEYAERISVILEYVHTSSLLHDDVIDNATVRRGKPSANVIYNNRVTVLSGDYLYTSAFLSILDLPDREHSRVLTKAVAAMSEGELLQMQKTGDLGLSMDDYKRIIYGKTAALFSAACECGALLGKASPIQQQKMRDYGRNIGYVFQMKDDLLDYFGSEKEIGKKPGTDLMEKKVTLPILLLLKKLDKAEKKEFSKLFLDESADNFDKILTMLKKHNIDAEATAILQDYIDKALESLDAFDDSEYKRSIIILTEELSDRIS